MSDTKVITKDTIKRLLSDVKYVFKNPLTDNGIYYVHDDEDMLKKRWFLYPSESVLVNIEKYPKKLKPKKIASKKKKGLL